MYTRSWVWPVFIGIMVWARRARASAGDGHLRGEADFYDFVGAIAGGAPGSSMAGSCSSSRPSSSPYSDFTSLSNMSSSSSSNFRLLLFFGGSGLELPPQWPLPGHYICGSHFSIRIWLSLRSCFSRRSCWRFLASFGSSIYPSVWVLRSFWWWDGFLAVTTFIKAQNYEIIIKSGHNSPFSGEPELIFK